MFLNHLLLTFVFKETIIADKYIDFDFAFSDEIQTSCKRSSRVINVFLLSYLWKRAD